MVRILVVGKGAPDRGGIAAHLAGLLESPLARDHELSFLNLTRPETDPAGGRFTLRNVRRTVRDLAVLWRACAGAEVVSIHSALEPTVTMVRAGSFALVARSRKARVFVHAHGGGLRFWLRGRPRRMLTRMALAPCHAVIAVAEGERRVLSSVLGPDRVRLVENGVDVHRFDVGDRAGVDVRPPRVLYAGLLTPRKGVVDLLAASAELVARGVVHELILAGGTPDEGRTAEDEVRAAAHPCAQFLGPQPHERMPELYRQADVFVLPSWWEAFPISLLEAMASGLPVIATSVGDIPTLVEDGVTGILTAPKDVDALTEALERLLADPDLRRRMGEAGRLRVQTSYRVDVCARRLERIFLRPEPSARPAAAS